MTSATACFVFPSKHSTVKCHIGRIHVDHWSLTNSGGCLFVQKLPFGWEQKRFDNCAMMCIILITFKTHCRRVLFSVTCLRRLSLVISCQSPLATLSTSLRLIPDDADAAKLNWETEANKIDLQKPTHADGNHGGDELKRRRTSHIYSLWWFISVGAKVLWNHKFIDVSECGGVDCGLCGRVDAVRSAHDAIEMNGERSLKAKWKSLAAAPLRPGSLSVLSFSSVNNAFQNGQI